MSGLDISYYSDIPAFGSRMRAALNGSRPYTDCLLAIESGLMSIDTIRKANSKDVPYINWSIAEAAPSLSIQDFGSLARANMFTPTIGYSDTTIYSTGLGLDIANIMSSRPRIDVYSEMVGSIDFDLALNSSARTNGTLGSLSALNLGNIGYNPTILGNVNQNTDYAKFDKKVKLLTAMGYEEEVQEVKNKMQGNYKKGIELLDAIIKKADKSDIEDAVQEIYEEDQKTKLEAAKNISNAWASQIVLTGTNDEEYNAKVNTASINKNNVLDVLGTYLTNENISEGMWTDLIEANFKDIAKALKEKAKAMKRECNDETVKQQIQTAIDEFGKVSAETPQIGQATYEFFKTLRGIEASQLDSGAAAKYGVPQSTTIDNPTIATDRFNEEQARYQELESGLDVAA